MNNYDSLKITATTAVAKLLQEKLGVELTLKLINDAANILNVTLSSEEKTIIYAGIICNGRY